MLPSGAEDASEPYLQMDYKTFQQYLAAEGSAKERRYYLHHLERNQYNIQKTAQELGSGADVS